MRRLGKKERKEEGKQKQDGNGYNPSLNAIMSQLKNFPF
jgi:hypothetical protein